MFTGKQHVLLDYCHDLAADADATLQTVYSAAKKVGDAYRINRLEIDISGDKDYMPEMKTRYLTLYKNTEDLPEGEPIEFRFPVSHNGELLTRIFPSNPEFSEEEKQDFEVMSNITFFYFGRIRLSDAMQTSAMTQYLTGLPNAGGYTVVATELFKNKRLQDYSAFYFNLRGFGRISSRYGQEEGNEIMKRYASRLQEFKREDEVIGHLGGDNFTALIKKDRKMEFIAFLSAVDAHSTHNGQEELFKLSATIGVWDVDDRLREPGEIIGLPSIAMNLAKNVMHQSVVEISDDILGRVSQRKEVLETFQNGLEEEEFQVFYQPKVDSRTKTLVGAEGLVRWFKNGQMVSPGVFIPALEEEGEIINLDYYMLEHACADIRRWTEEGIEPVTVSVNFSRKDLSDPELAEHINSIIEASGIDKKLIQIEVTETMDAEEHGALVAFLDKLYGMGIQTAIDDFGSGYSSLSTLRELKVHTLKIDRSFINTETFSQKDEIILTDIIHMANELGMHVITEGVERDDQLAFVNSAGCYLIQGFYYDRPLPKDEFRKRLEDKTYEGA